MRELEISYYSFSSIDMTYHLLLLLLYCLVQLATSLTLSSSVLSIKLKNIPISSYLTPNKRNLLIFSTYAADFNAIEYTQRLRHYLPELKLKSVDVTVIMNASPTQINKHCDLLALDQAQDGVTYLSDPCGEAGRSFDVCRGFRPDDNELNPYIKLYLMLFGLGGSMTLPSVITGYLGNPWRASPWITTALVQGAAAGRFPGSAVDGTKNNFDDLPVVGSWGRRPLELATLRLMNMGGVSFGNWRDLIPGE